MRVVLGANRQGMSGITLESKRTVIRPSLAAAVSPATIRGVPP